MVGNSQGDLSGDIYVEFDYNNIILVDPNKTTKNGKISERLVDHENLVTYVNLEAELLPRTKLAIGSSPSDSIRTISIAKINFLKPTKNDYLTSGYYDDLTGKDALNKGGTNQVRKTVVDSQYVKTSLVNGEGIDNGLLGITSVNVKISGSFIPSVTIELEDVQGQALFQLGDNSPYAAFFNLPYPPFYLTMKGYYGQAVKYQLNLITFSARFDSQNGNYKVTLEFQGYKFNILNEISMSYLLATPHMYSKTYNVSTSTNTNSKNVLLNQIVSEGGTEKIREVYSEYKSPTKALLPEDFPELTFQELMDKLETFETRILETYSKVDVDPLTNIKNYKKELQNFFNKVYGGTSSWFSKNLNSKPFIKTDGEKFYIFKEDIVSNSRREQAVSELKSIIDFYNKLLQENPTLGRKGKVNEIKKSVSIKTLTGNCSFDEVDLKKSYIEQYGIYSPTEEQVKKFESDIVDKGIFSSYLESDPADPNVLITKKQTYFFFEGVNRFVSTLKEIEAEANKKLGEYEEKISSDLAEKIEDTNVGLGFRPSVRNIIAIIMANAEAFIRLLDDVHTKAWNVKYDDVRKNAILNNNHSVMGPDTKDLLNKITENQSNDSNGQIPVYPWPQFFVETQEDKKGRFQLKYIADPSIVQLTQGYNYDKWPEVEFVEEFLKGLTFKFESPQYNPAKDNLGFTNLLNINAIEFPQTGLPYSNKEEIKFFYEIWERQFLTSRYTNLARLEEAEKNEILNLIVDVESSNLITSMGVSNPYLNMKLKNYGLSSNTYLNFLKTISNNGSGTSWQKFIRDIFVTPYINSLTKTDYSHSIIDVNNLGKEPSSKINSEVLEKVVKTSTTNKPNIFDIYPFTDETWCQNNLMSSERSGGDEVFNTSNVLRVYQQKNIISNFTDINDFSNNRPVTNFSYLNPLNPLDILNYNDLSTFYNSRVPNDFVPTEGFCKFLYQNGTVTPRLTTSMLNTPFFINSIIQGVDNSIAGDNYPYKEAAYLFINSLPLTSLRERYKSNESGQVSNTINTSLISSLDSLDYIFATMKKFGGVHKLPYAWILKMGSIWHRYKTYKEKGIDILTVVWRDFDYKNNFDPITNSTNKIYSLNFDGGDQKIQLEQVTLNTVSVQSGFYPKLIDKFNIFYNNSKLFQSYSDNDIQTGINNGLKIYNFSNSNITSSIINGVNNTYKPWSVLVKSNITADIDITRCGPTQITFNEGYYVIPSFGGEFNECYDAISGGNVGFSNNNSLYNGSVRLFWSAPVYGYFDVSQIKKPDIDSYIFKLKNQADLQSPFDLSDEDDYTKIEEMFSVFDKSVLDSFEKEFLNFSKPIKNKLTNDKNFTYNQSQSKTSGLYTNFQSLFRSLMFIPDKTNQGTDELFSNASTNQFLNFSKVISNFLEFDVLFRYGNPSNYDRRVFDSFLSHNLPTPTVIDPIQFNGYLTDSLPSSNGTQTLLNSKIKYPNEWNTLETYVGFSTIPELVYSDQGSYITDFFIDNNIEFTVQNIQSLSALIKIYATQKLKNKSINNTIFRGLIDDYFNKCNDLQNVSLNGILNKVSKELPNYDLVPERTIQSVIDGQQSKVEAYELFKALNDKWISGTDYKTKTLLEDILFLDKASRNIGDTLLLDIFDLKNIINQSSLKTQLNMSVYTFIAGILIRNNFTIMNLPAYVNFYNVRSDEANIVPKPDQSLVFANNIWGTHLTVDTRESDPKMVCFYVGKPSSYLDLPKSNLKYRDDAFNFDRFSESPLIENITNKKDYSQSNRCVGFSVDIGIRNQNIFNNFTVSQENGKATSESVTSTYDMINQASGRNTATQNVGLYNLYKQRSYRAQVISMGNAMIQPTMYFNLRHVPMFNGPYMITDVSHVITPGSFQTTFQGIRQGIFDLPSIDSYLQSINRNLLTKLETSIRNRKEDIPKSRTDNKALGSTIVRNSNNTVAEENSCVDLVLPVYTNDGYVSTQTTTTEKNISDFINLITGSTAPFVNLQGIIYSICYLNTFKDDKFVGNNNNFAVIDLETDFGETSNRFVKTFSCLNTENFTVPIANFESPEDFMTFMNARLQNNVLRITTEGLYKYYVCNWPTSKNKLSSEEFEKKKNTEYYQFIQNQLRKGLISARDNGLLDLGDNNQINILISGSTTNAQNPSNPQNNLNTTNTTLTPCSPPVIYSITPTTGNTNTSTVVTISGESLFNIYSVKVNNQNCKFTNLSNNIVTVTIPFNVNGTIEINTDHGQVLSTQSFQYLTTSNTQLNNGIINPQGQVPPTQQYDVTFTYLGEQATITGNDESYYNVEKNNGRFAVLKIFDPFFTDSNVDSVTSYNISGNPVNNTIEYGQNTSFTKLCNVNNKSSDTYYWILKYRPNGPGTSPILEIKSDNWTQ